MNKLQPAEKSRVQGKMCAEERVVSEGKDERLAAHFQKGVPLNWHESKSPELWRAVLSGLRAGQVCDLTAGSGCLAMTCLGGLKDQAVDYCGLAAAVRGAEGSAATA